MSKKLETVTAVVTEDLDEIGPGIGLHIEIPVEGFNAGDTVKVEYRITKTEPEEIVQEPEAPTLKVYSTEEVLKFMTKHYGRK
jgi:hypothetical protein